MKKINFLAALLLAVVYVGLSSCNKDDGGKNLLVGTWVNEDIVDEITFNADGSGVAIHTDGNDKFPSPFTYKFDGKTMTLTMKYDNEPAEGSGKIEITGDELKITDDEGIHVYHRKK